MSINILILGESGTGKTSSLRNVPAKDAFLVQAVRKVLPFRCPDWREITFKVDANGKYRPANRGNIVVSQNAQEIQYFMKSTRKPIICIDDFGYVLSGMFMDKRAEKGYDKFSEIAGAGYDICRLASNLASDTRVYIFAHTQTDDYGNTRIKTIGKMLDEKIVLEGLFTIVLRTHVEAGKYYFSTHNTGTDTTKSPIGMFDSDLIDNDLALVDRTICDYYGIKTE